MFIAYLVQKYRQTSQESISSFNLEEKTDAIVEQQFNNATSHLPSLIGTLPKNLALQFYGLYKQASEGPPDISNRPSWYEGSARYKFDAWLDVCRLSREEAMKRYCQLLRKVDPSWDPSKKLSSGWNIKPSMMGTIDAEMFDDVIKMEPVGVETEIERQWFEAARNDDVETVKLMYDMDHNLLEAKDQHLAMTALARSVDLGCESVASYLIGAGADVNVTDQEGQTPLHFAAQCNRRELSELLIMAGADKTAKDTDGNIPAQLCTDDDLMALLRPE